MEMFQNMYILREQCSEEKFDTFWIEKHVMKIKNKKKSPQKISLQSRNENDTNTVKVSKLDEIFKRYKQ